MHYILNIETATTVCSVSLSMDGNILGYKEIDNGFTHSENLHLFINELLIDFNPPKVFDFFEVKKEA